MSSISSMFAAGIDQVRRSWGWFLVTGIVLMVLGIACIGKAQTATTFSILALGWVLAISGVFWLISSFQAWTWGGFFVYLLNAIRNPPSEMNLQKAGQANRADRCRSICRSRL